MMIGSNASRNDQAYVDPCVTRHLTRQLSTRSRLFRSKYMVRGSHVRKIGAPFFHKGVGNPGLTL